MAGSSFSPEGVPSFAQSEVQARVAQLCAERRPPPDAPSPQEAASALLRGRTGYESVPLESVVAPYVPGTVSLPDSNVGAPRVEDVLPEEAARYLVGFDDLMLRSSDDILEMEDHGPSLEPYSDPVLKHDDSKYVDFVNDLVQRGLVSFTVTPRERAAFFFVKKKSAQADS